MPCQTVNKANGDTSLSLLPHSEAMRKDCTMKIDEKEEEGEEGEGEGEGEGESPSLSDQEREADPLSLCFADEDIPTRVRQHQTCRTLAVHSPLNRDLFVKLTKDDIIAHLSKLKRDTDSEKRLHQLFSSLTTLTAQEDMLRTLRCECICIFSTYSGNMHRHHYSMPSLPSTQKGTVSFAAVCTLWYFSAPLHVPFYCGVCSHTRHRVTSGLYCFHLA